MVSLNAKPDWLWIQFVDHNAITAWASHSGLVVDGDKPNLIFRFRKKFDGRWNPHEIAR